MKPTCRSFCNAKDELALFELAWPLTSPSELHEEAISILLHKTDNLKRVCVVCACVRACVRGRRMGPRHGVCHGQRVSAYRCQNGSLFQSLRAYFSTSDEAYFISFKSGKFTDVHGERKSFQGTPGMADNQPRCLSPWNVRVTIIQEDSM